MFKHLIKNFYIYCAFNTKNKIMKKIRNVFLAMGVLAASMATAQLKTPQPSPSASITQTVGLIDVKIDYSRPGMKGRTVFGGIVPFGEIWRTGANKATAITLPEDVKIGGKDVKAGSYSIFTIPNETEWTIIINNNTELWGAGAYKQEEDAARFTVKPTKITDAYETFTIDFSDLTSNSAHINLIWENTKVAFKIETNANEAVEAQIKEILVDGPSAGTYYGAARYYLDNDKDLKQALTWIDVAIEKNPNAFWYIHQKAKIQGKLGMKKEAIATAQKSMEMAKANKEGDYGYVKNNEDLIKELKSKK